MKYPMRQFFLSIAMLVSVVGGCALPYSIHAIVADDAEESTAQPQVNYYYGVVTRIITEDVSDDPNLTPIDRFSQTVSVRFTTGPDAGMEKTLSFTPGSADATAPQNLKVGEKIIIAHSVDAISGEPQHYIYDRYRATAVWWLAAAFFILVVLFAGWKGVRSILGLAFSVVVVVWFIIPNVLHGANPFFIFLVGALAITLVSIYIGHGFNRRTTVAVVSTIVTIIVAVGLSVIAVQWAKLFGLGSEEAFYLQVSELSIINLRGLLLGSIIIGVLGVLDDVTTTQSATVAEIYLANPKLSLFELVKRSLRVGHEHIVSLVNTLALAYVGASFPLLLLFTESHVPLWIIFNSERVIEEVVRTLIGSTALVLAVPISTYLAAYVYHRFGVTATSDTHHHH